MGEIRLSQCLQRVEFKDNKILRVVSGSSSIALGDVLSTADTANRSRDANSKT
jgi:hypothetical protein